MKSKIRLVFQLIIVAIIIRVIIVGWDIEAFCPLGGILSFGTQLYQNTMACSMSEVAIFMAFALIVATLLIGKLFCSYICPVGVTTEWFGKLGKKLRLHFMLPTMVDRFFRVFKYALLFFVLYYTITSSELFCKKFEPYYGVASGFDTDVVLWWSLAAIALTIIGSIFIKQFWCKYLCPLGAISNIFANIYLVVIPFVVFFILRLNNPDISLAWLFGMLVLAGLAWEVGVFRFVPLPATKITVDQEYCTQCELCMEACPYGIKVFEYKKVDHPDCMMCSDCVYACEEEDVIGINRSRKLLWLPPVMVVVLPLLGFLLSTQYEFATLERRWGGYEQKAGLAQYKQAGISEVKCYGSSLSLMKKIDNVEGIYGLDTYARSHAVTIYYDPEEIDEMHVKEAIFRPRRYKTRKFTAYKPDSLAVWEVGIDNFFDLEDNMNLVRILRQSRHVFGFESHFGEPVLVRIFYCDDSTSAPALRKLIDDTKRVEQTVKNKQLIHEMDFSCANDGRIVARIDRGLYGQRMFGSYTKFFNGYENVDQDKLNIYEIGMPDADNLMLRRRLPYLVSHISEDSSIVGFATSFINSRPVAHVYFDPAGMDTATISALLQADTLYYFKSDNTRGALKNGFTFAYPSTVFAASGFADPVARAKKLKLGTD